MNKEKMVPEIRLSGFNESWKKIKLGSYSKILTGGTPKTRIKEYWYPKDIPWMSSGEVNKKRLYSTDNLISNLGLENSSARWVKEKAVLIALAGQGKTRGTVAINEIPLTTNQSIAAIEVCDILSSEFLYQNLGNRYEELRLLSSGDGSRGGLNKKIISDIKIITPKIEEQQKIGSLFKNIDEVITLQQQLLTDYKQLKKAMLQQLFPQKGEKVPQIRFAGFYDEWKIKELGEVVPITMGQSPSSENYTDNPDDHILVQGNADMKNGRVVPRVWTTEITKTAEKDDLILSVRAPVGKIGRTDYNIVLGRGVAGIRGNHFIYYSLLQLDTFGYWVRFSTGSTFESINSKDIKEAIFLLPSDDEQEKIGNFFKQLDETIAAHEQKLATYQELKKALLQRMFV